MQGGAMCVPRCTRGGQRTAFSYRQVFPPTVGSGIELRMSGLDNNHFHPAVWWDIWLYSDTPTLLIKLNFKSPQLTDQN